jgi:hypothetical protein
LKINLSAKQFQIIASFGIGGYFITFVLETFSLLAPLPMLIGFLYSTVGSGWLGTYFTYQNRGKQASALDKAITFCLVALIGAVLFAITLLLTQFVFSLVLQ